jgi:CubicO group peptidase (beta-lactamase class C family)
VFLFAASVVRADDKSRSITPVPDQEILDELKSAPRDNVERVQRLRELYIQAGAEPDEIRLQEVKGTQKDDPLLHNVIVTKKGSTDRVIVVGGHLDKVAPGDGIIDDWSGSCLAANLYQTIRELPTTHTFVFMGFAYEEQGLVGSRLYVDSLSDAERKKIKAMVNLEVLGVDGPFIWTNGSTDSLEVIAHQVADEHKVPLKDHKILGVGADSIPFDRVGIPNITFDGLAVEHFAFIHSDLDKFENISPDAYLNAYRLASNFIVTLDRRLGETPAVLAALDPKTVKRVDDYVQAEMTKRHIPGLSIAVVQDGEVVHAKGYGQANVELSVPATADTVYQIGSITKQFSATAIMMLVEEEKLALDDPISKHLDKTPDSWKDVTVRHLLNHTSGIKSYTSIADNMTKNRLDRSKDDIIGSVRDLPLEFEPGAKWSYNNSGYFLLGLIIEKVSGKPYAEFLDERIFKPLGMTATRVNDLREIVPNRSVGYQWTGTRLQNAEHTSMTWPFSAGAIVSTVSDLAKWDAALCTVARSASEGSATPTRSVSEDYSPPPKLVQPSTLAAMWTPTKLSDGKKQDYGFGWGVGNYRSRKLIGHGGGIQGFTTDIARFVDDKLTVIVLTNLSGPSANPASLARDIAGFYLSDLAPVAEKPIEDKDPKATELFKNVLQATIDGTLDPELFTESMRKEIFPDRINQAKQFLAPLGQYKSFTLVEFKEEGKQRTIRYKVAFAQLTLVLTGTLAEDGKIAGMTITPE